jgi:beta-xylosidase
MLGGYFKLCFIVTNVDNLDANLEDYFELFFIMADVDNVYTNIWDYLNYL